MTISNNKGVTLVALIVTIVVIIIIASITAKVGMDLVYKSRVENFVTNMLIIKSKARVIEEEVESKIWDFGNEIDDETGLTKKEKGRREHFANEYDFELIEDASKYKMKHLDEDAAYYALTENALKKMGLRSLWEEEKSYYVVKYTIKDSKYEDIEVYYTKGVKYKTNKYYSLSMMQEILN